MDVVIAAENREQFLLLPDVMALRATAPQWALTFTKHADRVSKCTQLANFLRLRPYETHEWHLWHPTRAADGYDDQGDDAVFAMGNSPGLTLAEVKAWPHCNSFTPKDLSHNAEQPMKAAYFSLDYGFFKYRPSEVGTLLGEPAVILYHTRRTHRPIIVRKTLTSVYPLVLQITSDLVCQ
jgi:hypothetical protein